MRRPVIQTGMTNYAKVEVYSPHYSVFIHNDPTINEFEIGCSRTKTVGELKSMIAKLIGVDMPATIRLWSGFSRTELDKREDLMLKIEETTMVEDRFIMVERKVGDTWQYDQRYQECRAPRLTCLSVGYVFIVLPIIHIIVHSTAAGEMEVLGRSPRHPPRPYRSNHRQSRMLFRVLGLIRAIDLPVSQEMGFLASLDW